ncbi:dihydrofolate reductase [Paenibacillus sp. ISL-20]|uniref:dihydrofolate reductase n=1 Tax=Paenibacillus sp. ISL-20 TaxID=2819163 RepID=UPI001BE950A9|nr:dihydrofolate reductase [Paenibacillus sp. ISL-20]MBT2759983.1 dihydrofolate reductase [Paenibacillus sp. ISL-20]
MTFSLIVAYDQNRLIGSNNQLPWHIPADLQHFKLTTLNKTVVMGRKTFESIGKSLSNRTNLILTSDKSYTAEGCTVLHSIDDILDYVADNLPNETIVIGGSELYTQFLPYVNKMYVTEIDASFVGDSYFPEINPDEWYLSNAAYIPKGYKTPHDLIIKELIK